MKGADSAFWRGGGLRSDEGELHGGCLPAEGFTGAGVEFGGDGGDSAQRTHSRIELPPRWVVGGSVKVYAVCDRSYDQGNVTAFTS